MVLALLMLFVLGWESQNQLWAQEQAHPIVPAFERFIDVESVNDVERGSLLINELNCASCHQSNESSWSVGPKQAPILTDIAKRVRPKFFEKFILDPHSAKPGTTMPDVLASKAPSEKKQIAESIAHFLASTGSTNATPPMPGPVANGQNLFHSIGCVAVMIHKLATTHLQRPCRWATLRRSTLFRASPVSCRIHLAYGLPDGCPI